MEKLLVKGLAIVAIGGITVKALKAVRYYKQQVEEHEEVMEGSDDKE